MKRAFVITIILLAAAFVAAAQQSGSGGIHPSDLPLAKTEAEKKILGEIDEMAKSHHTYLSVPIQDGMALRLLTEVAGAKNVIEIGTSTGYSGL